MRNKMATHGIVSQVLYWDLLTNLMGITGDISKSRLLFTARTQGGALDDTLIHVVHRALFILTNVNPHQTGLQHPLVVNPWMDLSEKLRPVLARPTHQLRHAAGVVLRIWRDIVDSPAEHHPRIVPFPPVLFLEHRGRYT